MMIKLAIFLGFALYQSSLPFWNAHHNIQLGPPKLASV